jgi:hypothetical protein
MPLAWNPFALLFTQQDKNSILRELRVFVVQFVLPGAT